MNNNCKQEILVSNNEGYGGDFTVLHGWKWN